MGLEIFNQHTTDSPQYFWSVVSTTDALENQSCICQEANEGSQKQ